MRGRKLLEPVRRFYSRKPKSRLHRGSYARESRPKVRSARRLSEMRSCLQLHSRRIEITQATQTVLVQLTVFFAADLMTMAETARTPNANYWTCLSP